MNTFDFQMCGQIRTLLPPHHALRFASLFNPGKAIVVPCDEQGRVDIDALPDRMRTAYLGARALVGREYAYPVLDHLH